LEMNSSVVSWRSMNNKIRGSYSLERTIHFDCDFLKEINRFLEKKYDEIKYRIELSTHSIESFSVDELINFISDHGNEIVKRIEIECRKKVGGDKFDEFELVFRRTSLWIPNISIIYRVFNYDESAGFFQRLQNNLFKNKVLRWSFLYDGNEKWFPVKILLRTVLFLALFLLLFYLFTDNRVSPWQIISRGYELFEGVSGWDITGVACVSFFAYKFLLSIPFPRMVFALTEKEKTISRWRQGIRKLYWSVILTLIGSLIWKLVIS